MWSMWTQDVDMPHSVTLPSSQYSIYQVNIAKNLASNSQNQITIWLTVTLITVETPLLQACKL